MTKFPNSPYPKRGTPDAAAEAIGALTAPLRDVVKDVAALVTTHHLESATVTVSGTANGTVELRSSEASGIHVSVTGSLDAGTIPSGTPYYAHYNGEFFWRQSPDSPDFVHSGDTVSTGQLVGWAMGESKDMSFGLRSDTDGIIRLVTQNASKVVAGETLLYYIEEA